MKETSYWLKLIVHANPRHKDKCSQLQEECTELIKILSKTVKTSKENK